MLRSTSPARFCIYIKRHEGPGILSYKQEGLGRGEIINPDAYDDEDKETVRWEKNEQAGVAH